MDEVRPSITEVKLKACIVAIYVTGLVICHLSFVLSNSPFLSPSPEFKAGWFHTNREKL
ncbi:hypothetical protein [Nostoc sp.]|uniref:hypothetical protein n=1 Tax=Nostoc sp. TaxID=1180 RepID=UPI002FF916F2